MVLRRGRKILARTPPEEVEIKNFPVWPFALMFLLACLVAVCTIVKADEIEFSDAVHAIIGEAENQGDQGLLSVACALANRGTLKGVYGLKAYRVIHHKYSKRTEQMASMVWTIATNTPDYCGFLKGADVWGTASDVSKFKQTKWFNNYILVAKIKDHYFFKKKSVAI